MKWNLLEILNHRSWCVKVFKTLKKKWAFFAFVCVWESNSIPSNVLIYMLKIIENLKRNLFGAISLFCNRKFWKDSGKSGFRHFHFSITGRVRWLASLISRVKKSSSNIKQQEF